MTRAVTTTDVVNEVRSLLDEYNEKQVSDSFDVFPSLNAGLNKAWQVLSRVYPDPLLDFVDVTGIVTDEIDIPEQIFSDKIKVLEWCRPNATPYECQKVSLHLLRKFFFKDQTSGARCYAMHGRKIRFNAKNDGSWTLRIWFIREVEKLVAPIARITNVDGVNGKLYVTDVSDTFNPTASDLTGYFNVIDGSTGLIKSSFQIKSWNGVDEIDIKSIPDRTSVLSRTISTSIQYNDTDLNDVNANVTPDDYICALDGTCVIPFYGDMHMFVRQWATAELKRKLGYSYDADQTLLKDFESELRKTYMGRQAHLRIKSTNPNWRLNMFKGFWRRRAF